MGRAGILRAFFYAWMMPSQLKKPLYA